MACAWWWEASTRSGGWGWADSTAAPRSQQVEAAGQWPAEAVGVDVVPHGVEALVPGGQKLLQYGALDIARGLDGVAQAGVGFGKE